MADIVMKTNDLIQITIPPPTIIPDIMAPVPLLGTGSTVAVASQPLCLLGDELPPTLRRPLTYTAPPFVTPGMGTLTLILNPTNMTKQTYNGKLILIKGSPFQAIFTVTVPATQPTPVGPVPDPVLTKPGTAVFIPSTPTVLAG